MPTTALRRYTALLSAPGVPRVVVAGGLGRLPQGMAPLAIVLVLRGSGHSYAAAGIVVAAYSLAIGAASPVLARLIDRSSQAPVLVGLAIAYPFAVAALAVLAQGHTPLALIIAVAALAGAASPPLGACMRALWPHLITQPGLRSAAYAFEATVQEFVFIVGPTLVALITTAASATAALLSCAASCAIGTLAFATAHASREWRGHVAAEGPDSALASRGVRTVLGATIGMGAAFGTLEVSMPAFAELHGHRAAAGIILAATSAGSLVGGLLIADRTAGRVPSARYLIALGALTATLLPLLLAWSIPAMTVLAFAAGLPIAPCFAVAYLLIDELAHPGTMTEAFAWISSCVVLGVALGDALGGATIPTLGVRASLALAAAFAGLGLLVALAGRSSLSPAGVARTPMKW